MFDPSYTFIYHVIDSSDPSIMSYLQAKLGKPSQYYSEILPNHWLVLYTESNAKMDIIHMEWSIKNYFDPEKQCNVQSCTMSKRSGDSIVFFSLLRLLMQQPHLVLQPEVTKNGQPCFLSTLPNLLFAGSISPTSLSPTDITYKISHIKQLIQTTYAAQTMGDHCEFFKSCLLILYQTIVKCSDEELNYMDQSLVDEFKTWRKTQKTAQERNLSPLPPIILPSESDDSTLVLPPAPPPLVLSRDNHVSPPPLPKRPPSTISSLSFPFVSCILDMNIDQYQITHLQLMFILFVRRYLNQFAYLVGELGHGFDIQGKLQTIQEKQTVLAQEMQEIRSSSPLHSHQANHDLDHLIDISYAYMHLSNMSRILLDIQRT